MQITQTELQLVKDCLDRLRDEFEPHSTYFYEALFRRAPAMRKMFRDDLAGQGMKFMTTLDVIVQKLDDEEQIAQQYSGLGQSHARLGIHQEDFASMEEALIDTIRHACADDFTPEMEQAWRKAYAVVSSNMIRRGAIAA